MIRLLKSSLGRLRIIGFIEGVSLIVILFISMPLKYFYSMGDPNKVVGMFHGILFFLYLFAVMQTAFELQWKTKTWFLAILASIIPFGTFWADKKLFRIESKYGNT